MIDFILILALCATAWFWWDSAYCSELALINCRKQCEVANLQLLDGSVVRRRIWLRRNENSNLQICRLYGFEYSDGTDSRQSGYIVLLGHNLVEIRFEQQQVH